jgi:hypothetical protein
METEREEGAIVERAVRSQEVAGEDADVLGPLAQGRQHDRLRPQAHQEIAAQGGSLIVVFDLRGRGHYPHVHGSRLTTSQRHHLALLQEAEQLRLRPARHVAQLIQEQRPAFRLLDEPPLRLGRLRVRPPRVAKELALDQLRGNGRAVEPDELASPPSPSI